MNRTLALSLLALALATGAAQAGCPRGQIYRVSKHACIDHDEAVKLGIIHGPAHNTAKPEAEAAQEPAAPTPALQEAVPQQAASPATAPEAPVIAQPATAPEPEAASSAPQVKTVRTVKIAPPKPAAPAPAEPLPLKTEAAAAPNPFGALDPGGVPMSQPR